MFKQINLAMRFLFFVWLLICSPLIFVISIIFAKSWKELFEVTKEIVTLPLQDIDGDIWNIYRFKGGKKWNIFIW
jgi:hypothetical protein